MKNEKIKELENFANDFNKRLDISELELEDFALYKKINNKNNNNKYGRNIISEFNHNSLSTSPIRSKSQFRAVIKIFII